MTNQEHDCVYKSFRWLANRFIDDYINRTMDSEMIITFDKFYQTISKSIDWSNLTVEDVKKLGFITWAQEPDEFAVWMIPAWLFPIIPEGTIVYDSNFNFIAFHRNEIPFISKYGYLTYGLRFKFTGDTYD